MADEETETLNRYRHALEEIQEIATAYLVRGAYQHQLYEIQHLCVKALHPSHSVSENAGHKIFDFFPKTSSHMVVFAWLRKIITRLDFEFAKEAFGKGVKKKKHVV